MVDDRLGGHLLAAVLVGAVGERRPASEGHDVAVVTLAVFLAAIVVSTLRVAVVFE